MLLIVEKINISIKEVVFQLLEAEQQNDKLQYMQNVSRS